MTQRPLFAASWWSRHFVCAVSSGELHKNGENVKKENCPYRVPVHPLLYADCSFKDALGVYNDDVFHKFSGGEETRV